MSTTKQGLFNEAECHKNDIYNKAYQDAKLTAGKIQPFLKDFKKKGVLPRCMIECHLIVPKLSHLTGMFIICYFSMWKVC